MKKETPRARDLGVPFEGTPGPLNAITDVEGVEVGHVTLIHGDGPLRVGHGPVRTGVTAIHPRGRDGIDGVFAGFFSLNGNGEMTGTAWIDESGALEGPILLTNTHSVGVARDAAIAWLVKRQLRLRPDEKRWMGWYLPVAAETWDGRLNDLNGFHIKSEHVQAALDNARGGQVAEGNVGGGTGMVCHQFKGGIGTASRQMKITATGEATYTVGALVQANHGRREQLRIAGLPVGLELPPKPEGSGQAAVAPAGESLTHQSSQESGSILVILATDAPLLPHQLKAIAKRGALGMARTGGVAGLGSGDLMLAFSTANRGAVNQTESASATFLGSENLTRLFEATAQATEEAVVNALVAARTMTGINGTTVEALPHEGLKQVLKKYNRMTIVT